MQQPSSSIKTKLIVIVVIIALAILGLTVGLQALQKRGKFAVEIYKVPNNTKITIDGSVIRDNTVYLNPGKHTVKGDSKGFQSRTIEIDVVSGVKEPTKALVSLLPESQEAIQWAKKNEKRYQELEGIAGDLTEKDSAKSIERHPIIKELPFRSDMYDIEYYSADNNFRVQIISRTGAMGRQVAIERIRSMGYNPSDYEIEFVNLYNPFSQKMGGSSNE